MTQSRRRLAAAIALAALAMGTLLWFRSFAIDLESSFQQRVRWSPNQLFARSDTRPGTASELVAISQQPDAAGRLRERISLNEVPPRLVDSVLAVEDRRFFEHGGIDLRRVAGAALANLRAGRVVQGGSTITQQLVRSVHLSRERSLRRKLREMLGALLLEWRHDKRVILEAYLNEIYLAQQGTTAIHGVALASRHTFGKPVAELSLSETALLAGMIRAPSVYSPLRDAESAKRRRNQVLGILLKTRRITHEQTRESLAEPIESRTPLAPKYDAAHFVVFAKRALERAVGPESVERGGLSVTTTLDLHLQKLAGRAVRTGLTQLETIYPELRRDGTPLEAALVAIEPSTGALRAIVGGRDLDRSSFDRAISARRQPGSAFKPIVALTALLQRNDDGPAYTLASLLADEPLRVEGGEGARAWQPSNHDGRFRGPVTLRDALQKSLNVPIARLGLAIGLETVIETARKLGIESRLEPMPSLTLGAFEVTPVELTGAYAVFAAGGVKAPVHAIESVNADGEEGPIPIPRAAPARVFDAATIHLVTAALQGTVDRGSAAPLRAYGYMGAVAGKTGTSDDFRDAWFVSYTPELAVGVWVGFDDGWGLGHAASEMALPIAAKFLRSAFGRHSGAHFRPPPGVVRARIEVQQGERCRRFTEVFLSGSVPESGCASPEAVDLP